MNSIHLTCGSVTEIKQFKARGETGVDVYIQDKNEHGTAYFQVEYYGRRAEDVLAYLQVGDQVNIAGTLVVNTYKKKDGTYSTMNVIKNPGPMYIDNRGVTVADGQIEPDHGNKEFNPFEEDPFS